MLGETHPFPGCIHPNTSSETKHRCRYMYLIHVFLQKMDFFFHFRHVILKETTSTKEI